MGLHQTSECLHLVVEFCAGRGAGAGQASMAVVQAGSVVSVGATLLQHRQEGHGQDRKQTFSGDEMIFWNDTLKLESVAFS